jgi:hypothetical protein
MTGTQRAIGPLPQQRRPAVRQHCVGYQASRFQTVRWEDPESSCPAAMTVSQRQVFSS